MFYLKKLYMLTLIIFSFNSIKSTIDYLDTTFGENGITTTVIGTNTKLNGLTVDQNGSIFATGTAIINGVQSLVLAKYNPNGKLNTNFGVGGIVSTYAGTSAVANAVVIDANNRIVVVGFAVINSKNNLFVVRYLPDGSLDLNFGIGGKITKLVATEVVANAVALDVNQSIIVGCTSINGGKPNLCIVKYDSNGILDSSFGTAGIKTLVGNNGYTLNSLKIDSSSRIVIGGFVTVSNSVKNLLVCRFKPDGTPDIFGTNGVVTTAIINYPQSGINSIAVDSSSIIVTGFAGTNTDTNTNFLTARYKLNGSLDTSFGSTSLGYQIDNIGANSQGNAILNYSNGKIMAGGFSSTNSAILKYNVNGSFDESFGIKGLLTQSNVQINSLVFQPLDGKLIAGGFSSNGQNQFVLIKYNKNNYDFVNITSISGNNVNSKIPEISGTSSLANAQVDVLINGSLFKSVATNQFGNWNVGNTNVLPLGNNIIQVNLVQNSQEVASHLINIFVLDNLQEDSLFSYSTKTKTKIDSSYSELPFDNNIRLGTWAYDNSKFICKKTGVYYIEYTGIAGIFGNITSSTQAVNVSAMVAINNFEYVGSESNTNLDLIENSTKILSRSFIKNLNEGDTISLNYSVKIKGNNNNFQAGLIIYRDYLNIQPNYSITIIRLG